MGNFFTRFYHYSYDPGPMGVLQMGAGFEEQESVSTNLGVAISLNFREDYGFCFITLGDSRALLDLCGSLSSDLFGLVRWRGL